MFSSFEVMHVMEYFLSQYNIITDLPIDLLKRQLISGIDNALKVGLETQNNDLGNSFVKNFGNAHWLEEYFSSE